jgi:hypothetical protein
MSSTEGDARAAEIRSATETEPESVDVDELVDLLVFGANKTRRIAFDAYESLVSARPAIVDASVSRLQTHLTTDSAETRRRAALTAGILVEDYPDSFTQIVPDLRSIGDSTEPGREPAIVALSRVAYVRPTAVTPAVETLLDVCFDSIPSEDSGSTDHSSLHPESDGRAALHKDREQRDTVRLHAIAALTLIANEDPDVLVASVARIASLLEDDHHLIRAGACELLESLASSSPAAVDPFATDLAERAATDAKHPVPWRAADALVVLEAERPECVGEAIAPNAAQMSRFVEARDPDRRRAGSTLLADTALVEPASVEQLLPALRELLSDDDADVRANAVIALEAAGDSDDRATIEALGETDPDERVRGTASRVLK